MAVRARPTKGRQPLPASSIHTLCRRWRQVDLKEAYEASLLDERDDDGVAAIIHVCDREKRALVAAMHRVTGMTAEEAAEVIGVALAMLKAGDDPETVAPLLRLARHFLFRLSDNERTAA